MCNIPKWEKQEYSEKCWKINVNHHIKERGQYGDLPYVMVATKYA